MWARWRGWQDEQDSGPDANSTSDSDTPNVSPGNAESDPSSEQTQPAATSAPGGSRAPLGTPERSTTERGGDRTEHRSRRETPPPSGQSPKRKRTNTASGIDSVDSVDRDDDNERPGSQERPPQQHAQMGDNGPNDGELPSKKPKTPRNATAVAAAVATTRNDEGGAFCCPQRDSRVNTPGVAGAAAGAAAAGADEPPGNGESPPKRARKRSTKQKRRTGIKNKVKKASKD